MVNLEIFLKNRVSFEVYEIFPSNDITYITKNVYDPKQYNEYFLKELIPFLYYICSDLKKNTQKNLIFIILIHSCLKLCLKFLIKDFNPQ